MATATGVRDIYLGSLTTDGDPTIVTGNWTTKALEQVTKTGLD